MHGKLLYIIYLIKSPKYKKAFKLFSKPTLHIKHTVVAVAAIS